MGDYEFRAYRPGEEEAILETFNLVFSEDNPSFEPRTRADFDWAFTHNPAGIRAWVAMQGDVVAAFYGAQPNRVSIDGTTRSFAQIIDSMVHPDHRRGLKRPGLFVETAQRMLAETMGEGPEQDILIYGWPVPPAWRMGKTFLEYDFVRMESILARGVGGGGTDLPPGVELVSAFDDSVDALYARCSRDWGASVIRDAPYLNWRFADNPRHDYELLTLTNSDGSLGAYAVYRVSDWPLPASGLIMDWLVPSDAGDAAERMRDALLARGRASGAQHLLALFPEWTPWFARFQDWGFVCHPSDLLMSGRNVLPEHHMYWLRDNWWYQFAELDLA